jgi:hypothetical protein
MEDEADLYVVIRYQGRYSASFYLQTLWKNPYEPLPPSPSPSQPSHKPFSDLLIGISLLSGIILAIVVAVLYKIHKNQRKPVTEESQNFLEMQNDTSAIE